MTLGGGGPISEFFERHDVFHEEFIRRMHASRCLRGGGRGRSKKNFELRDLWTVPKILSQKNSIEYSGVEQKMLLFENVIYFREMIRF